MKFGMKPEEYIVPPFTECSKCNSMKVGVDLTSIEPGHRVCINCLDESVLPLPKLNKKVMYLDQFIISNLTKLRMGELKSKPIVEKQYAEINNRLEYALSTQLMIYPHSKFHYEESYLYNTLEQKNTYEKYSDGISFIDSESIINAQKIGCFLNWVESGKCEVKNFDVNSILLGNKDSFTKKIRISSYIERLNKYKDIEDIKKEKDNTTTELSFESEKWRNHPKLSLKKWHQIFVDEYKNLVINEKYFFDLISFRFGNKFQPKELESLIKEFNSLQPLQYLPVYKIQALLLSSIAFQINTGRKKNLNSNDMVDIDMISLYYPYVDAIFIDKNMSNLFDSQLASEIVNEYSTRVFSLSKKKEFFDYMDRLNNSISNDMLYYIKLLYGNT